MVYNIILFNICDFNLFIFSQAQQNKDVTPSNIDTVIVPHQTVYEYKILCATIHHESVFIFQ